MNATSRFLPSASSPLWVEGPSASTSPVCDLFALVDEHLLVDAGVLVRAAELGERVDLAAELAAEAVLLPGVVLDDDVVAGDLGDVTLALGDDDLAGVLRGARLDAGADVGRLGDEQRHGLLLHVGAHERPVRVVVLDEGDERRRDRDDLLRRDVHQVDLGRRDEVDLARRAVGRRGGADAHARSLRPAADEHAVAGEVPVAVERRRRLGDDVLLFLVGCEVDDLVGDRAVRRPCGTGSR